MPGSRRWLFSKRGQASSYFLARNSRLASSKSASAAALSAAVVCAAAGRSRSAIAAAGRQEAIPTPRIQAERRALTSSVEHATSEASFPIAEARMIELEGLGPRAGDRGLGLL